MNSTLVDQSAGDVSGNEARQAWMKTLSSAPPERLKDLWKSNADFNEIDFDIIRKPERGLVMVRGRAGGAGGRFNLGEMTVSRAAVRLEDGTTGVSYISGRDLDHALIAAKLDALMQSDRYKVDAQSNVITVLQAEMDQRQDERAAKVAATRVNFFTMVRTREDKK